MKKIILAALALLVGAPAFGADIAVKSPSSVFSNGYPTTKCGVYYGIGTGGSAVHVNGSVVGTEIMQGELDAIVGYTCPLGSAGFWFVEGSIGMDNVNGNVNGFAMSGPIVLMQRAGAGSPINALINPFGTSISLPSIPTLPSNVTTSPGVPYLFAGVVEEDVGVQLGLAGNSHQWLIAPLLGAGMLTRLSNNVVVDTWAGWQMNSQSFCPGFGVGCGKLGNGARVGVSFKY